MSEREAQWQVGPAGQAGCRCNWAGAPAGYAPKHHGQRAIGTDMSGCDGRPPAGHRSVSAALPRSFDSVTDQSGSRTGAVGPTVSGYASETLGL